MTSDSILLSMKTGEIVKFNSTSSAVVWAVSYGTFGNAIALHSNGTSLLAGGLLATILNFGVLNLSDGSVERAYSTGSNAYYEYILVS